MKLGRRHNYHKGQAAIRHYANQPVPFDFDFDGVNARLGIVS